MNKIIIPISPCLSKHFDLFEACCPDLNGFDLFLKTFSISKQYIGLGVKWSSCLPTNPKIRVQIPLNMQFFCNIIVEKRKLKQKVAAVCPLKTRLWLVLVYNIFVSRKMRGYFSVN